MSIGSAIGGGFKSQGSGIIVANSAGTQLVCDASADTIGTYVELLSKANNIHPSNDIEITLSELSSSTLQDGMFVHLALGDVGEEIIVIPDMMCRAVNGLNPTLYKYSFPLGIPSDVRISAGAQGKLGLLTTNININRGLMGIAQDPGLCKLVSIGADRANTRGTEVARSATINEFGAWVPLTASLEESIKGFVICGMRSNTSWSTASVTYQVGVGPVGEERVIHDGVILMTSSEEGSGNVSSFRNTGIKKGTRISVRESGSLNNTDLDYDYILHGAQ